MFRCDAFVSLFVPHNSPATKSRGRFAGSASAATVPRVGLKVRSKAMRSGCTTPRSREAGADASGFDSSKCSSDALGLVQRSVEEEMR